VVVTPATSTISESREILESEGAGAGGLLETGYVIQSSVSQCSSGTFECVKDCG
jgi:hypothetical protein